MQHTEAYYRELLSGYIQDLLTADQVRELYQFIEQEPELYEQLMNEPECIRLVEEKSSTSALELLPYADLRIRNQLLDHARDTGQQSNTHISPVTRREHFLQATWLRYAAAILLILGAGTYLWLANQKQHDQVVASGKEHQQPNITPGSPKATLTLADGSTIPLDSIPNGAVARQGNTQIMKLGAGQLVYGKSANPGTSLLFNTITTPRGGQYQVVLPDGSKAWLNAASSIRFPSSFNDKERKVEITGEAYFEIAKDATKPFRVYGNGQTIEVLGTSFNTNLYEDEPFKASLIEGSVKVNQSILKPGQAYTNGKIVTTNVEQDIAWKNNFFHFAGTEIREIMQQLSRWYNIEVSYKGSVHGGFYVKISRNEPLANILSLLELTNKVRFTINGRNIEVRPA
ncbi:MAG: FecR family protein [Chitinophagaceae bacterium]|nr:FecR family protein [Chitinophagaceae bacterium]